MPQLPETLTPQELDKAVPVLLKLFLQAGDRGYKDSIDRFEPLPSETNNWLQNVDTGVFEGVFIDEQEDGTDKRVRFRVRQTGKGWRSETELEPLSSFAESLYIEFASKAKAGKPNCNPAKSHFCRSPSGAGSCVSLKKVCRYKPKGDTKTAADYVATKVSRKSEKGSDSKVYQGELEPVSEIISVGSNKAEISVNPVKFYDPIFGEGVFNAKISGSYLEAEFKVNDTMVRQEFDNPRDGLRMALAVRKKYNEIFAKYPDGTVVANSPYTYDGAGDKRAAVYKAAGFGDLDEKSAGQYAIIKGGKLTPINKPELDKMIKKIKPEDLPSGLDFDLGTSFDNLF